MAAKYAECLRSHESMGGKNDGCHEFMKGIISEFKCDVCNCHRNFHRKVVPPVRSKTEVVYTKCHKNHDLKIPNSVDGCQQFIPLGDGALYCSVCNCHVGFHQKEIITIQF